jgi:DNA gyrase/topoisomerase IV subunit B
MAKFQYDASDIRMISWPEAVRLRPGMYIGAVNNKGVLQLLQYILIQICQENSAKKIALSFDEEGAGQLSFQQLSGRVDASWASRMSYREANLEVLNALCSRFEIRIYLKDYEAPIIQYYEQGLLKQGILEPHKHYECDSLEIYFCLDEAIFGMDFSWDTPYLLHELKAFAYLHKNTAFEIKTLSCQNRYHFPRGLKERLHIELTRSLICHNLELYFDEQIEHFSVECALALRNTYVDKPFIESYVNDYHTFDNGTHVKAVIKGILRAIRKYMAEIGMAPLDINKAKIQKNMLLMINIRMESVSFGGSTRSKLISTDIINPLADYVAYRFYQLLTEADSTTLLTKIFI